MITETKAIIAKARADIAAHAGKADAYLPIVTTIVDSVEALVTAVTQQGAVDKMRLEDLEARVLALATAVLAITESVSKQAPSILALHDDLAKPSGTVPD